MSELDNYLSFVANRHQVWEARQLGLPQPWCEDPIIRTRKFTNVFRILDYGTQFWVGDLAPEAHDERDLLYKALLYRFTNEPTAWVAYRDAFGSFPSLEDDPVKVGGYWVEYQDSGRGKVFSGAYMSRGWDGEAKAMTYARLCAEIVRDVAVDYQLADTQAERYSVLCEPFGMGKFMAMQVLTDMGYVLGYDEDEFIIAGPGAVKGLAVVWPGWDKDSAIQLSKTIVSQELPQVRLELPDGRTRLPSLMDIQNTFCEFSKYVRLRERPVGRPYVPQHPAVEPVYPNHW